MFLLIIDNKPIITSKPRSAWG